MSDQRVYLRPLGLVFGEAAAEAVTSDLALPFGGPGCAFPLCEIWSRRDDEIAREVVSAPALPARAAQLGAAAERTLQRLIEPPSWPDPLPAGAPLLMGVVNVTPDSFSDGGRFLDPERAVAHGLALWEAGAAIVDVGGESTRPGAAPLALDDEIGRVVPVIERLVAAGVRVSIDTRRAPVMEAALAAGASLINDVSALGHDPEAVAFAARHGVPVVLMHMQGEPATMQARPSYRRAALDVFDHLEARLEAVCATGIRREQLIVDPGIGFGKTLEHNVDILHHLSLYRGLGVPLLLGASRKSFLARLAGDIPAPERVPGSIAAALHGMGNGALILRVHDVAETRQALAVWRGLTN